MNISTWIRDRDEDIRIMMINEVEQDTKDIKIYSWYEENGYNYQAVQQRCIQDNIKLFLAHETDLETIEDGGLITEEGVLGIPTIVFGGGIGNEDLVGDNLVVVHDENFIEYLPLLIKHYLEKNEIDLSIMLGGIYNYYRLLRDNILDAFYDRDSLTFKDKPNTLNQELIDKFPCSKGCYDDMVKIGGQENFIKLRDSLNSEIKRKAFQSEGR
ncbi:hypothetical protein MASR1M36_12000 [Candidatus Cloacimonadaceae bacterium]